MATLRSTPLLPTFSFLIVFLPFASLAAPPSVPIYQNLLQCLSKHAIQSISKNNDHSNNAFSSSLSSASIIYTQKNPLFDKILDAYVRNARYNTSHTPKPQIIITPYTVSDISAAVLCAGAAGFRLSLRSGGHDYEGLSYVPSAASADPFAILDLFNLRDVAVDIASASAWVQAGATLGEVYYKIWNESLIHGGGKRYGFPAGICPSVGVGGHITGGGYGNMLRKHGLAVDNLLDAVVVDAGGRVLNRSSMGEDLFWAVRGGGGASFGVVVAYKIKLVEVPETVTVFRIEKSLDQNATQILYKYQLIANTTADELFIRVLVQPVASKTSKKSKTAPGTNTIRVTFIGMFLGDAEALLNVTNADFPELGLDKIGCLEMTWIQSVLWWANFNSTDPPEKLLNRAPDEVVFGKRKSDYVVSPISVENLERLWAKMVLGKVGLVFNPYGGEMGRIPSAAAPFPHRAGNIFKMQYSVSWREKDGGEAATEKFLKQARDLYEFLTDFVSCNPRRAFLNYRDLEIGTRALGKPTTFEEGSSYGIKYFGVENYKRLVQVKSRVDPHDVFQNLQSIPATRI